MKSIGGYFSLELASEKEYYRDAIRLNCGRNALEYILRTKKYSKLYLPAYTCDAIVQPLTKLNIAYEFYSINENLDPLNIKLPGNFEVFMYINYFGLKENTVKSLRLKIENYIIDNSQAFYSKPIADTDTFYSARKFFGVPDGAYLFMNSLPDLSYEKDNSVNRFLHLLKRIDSGPETGYQNFLENEKLFKDQPILKMSDLTHRLLRSINYELIQIKRRDNFRYLHDHLQSRNELSEMINNVNPINGPLIYPLLCEDGDKIRERLLNKKIYCATYWPNVLEWMQKNTFEYYLANNLVALPIDQRYDIEEMNYILTVLK